MKNTTLIRALILLTLVGSSSCGKMFKSQSGKDQSSNKPDANGEKRTVPKGKVQPPTEKLEDSPEGESSIVSETLDVGQALGLGLVNQGKATGLRLKQSKASQGQLVAVDETGATRPISLVKTGKASNIKSILTVGNYLYFVLNYYEVNIKTETGETCPMVAMRISDRRLYCIPDIDLAGSYYEGTLSNRIRSSSNGEVHFFEGSPRGGSTFSGYPYVYSVDFSASGMPVVRTIFNKAGYTSSRSMNERGDLLYVFYEKDAPHRSRVSKTGGGFQPLGRRSYLNCTSAGVGENKNDFYFFEGVAGNSNRIGRFKQGSDGFYTQEVVREDDGYVADREPSSTNTASLRCHVAATDTNRIVMIGSGTHDIENNAYISFLTIPSHELLRIQIPEMKDPEGMSILRDKIIIWGSAQAGGKLIVAMSKADNAFTVIHRTSSVEILVDAQEGSVSVNEISGNGAILKSQVISDASEAIELSESLHSFVTLNPK
jgi:hypothetical protein